MQHDYERCIRFWDGVFSDEEIAVPRDADTGNDAFNVQLDWICEKSSALLDFGCGNGVTLFLCALRGVKRLYGIDLSGEAIKSAIARSALMEQGEYRFICGGAGSLSELPDTSFDGALLYNILDNLYPEDCQTVLMHCGRLLKPGGRVVIRLNPCLNQEQIKAWNIRVISGNLLDDGLLLNNLSDAQWRQIISQHLRIIDFQHVSCGEQILRVVRAEKR